MPARFLLTVTAVTDPRDAVAMLNNEGEPTLLRAVTPRQGKLQRHPGRTIVEFDGDQIILRHDCVLLMMGTTSELEEAIQKVAVQGYRYIHSCWFDWDRDQQPIDQDIDQWRWYVRVRTGLTRTDTLIGIASLMYWRDAMGDRNLQHPRNGWEWIIGTTQTYYCQLDESRDRDRDLKKTRYLLDMIRDCEGEKWWIKPY